MRKKQIKQKAPPLKLQEWQHEANKDIKESEQEVNVEIPQQAEFFKTPIRFGNIPVDTLPLGCDEKEQYRGKYPKISLPFQTVEKISFGHKDLEPNQLIFGDNLHVMRALPSNSIDLIYIDPPFFSGRNYNVVFGDANEVRSFTDIWEGGMPGYLIWLNARLLEMKRLLKPTGSIYVHCDWHAGHYIKTEMDKIFGYENFRNEIVWRRTYAGKTISRNIPNNTDFIFWYSKSMDYTFNRITVPLNDKDKEAFNKDDKDGRGLYGTVSMQKVAGPTKGTIYDYVDNSGKVWKRPVKGWRMVQEKMKALENDNRLYFGGKTVREKYYLNERMKIGKQIDNLWSDIGNMNRNQGELIGYPTQKPEALLKRIMEASSKPGDVVADFFVGGGTTAAVAQKLGRRWIASDISKIAVSVTRDRILRDILGKNGSNKEIQHTLGKTPEIEIKSWGIYEVPELIKLNEDSFRNFIISAYKILASFSFACAKKKGSAAYLNA